MIHQLIFFSLLLIAIFYKGLSEKNNNNDNNKVKPLHIILCSNGTKNEPSFNEIFQSLIPRDISQRQMTKLRRIYAQYKPFDSEDGSDMYMHQLFTLFVNFFNTLGNTIIPIKTMISDGSYNIDMTTDWFFYRDVHLIQENHIFINSLCSVLPLQWSTARNLACQCFTGEKISSKDTVITSSSFGDILPQHNHQWCVRNPCTGKSSRDGVCQVTVNPLRTSCILIPQSTLPDFLSNDIITNNEEFTSLSDEQTHKFSFSSNLITYNLSIPMMDKKGYGFDRLFDLITNVRQPKHTYKTYPKLDLNNDNKAMEDKIKIDNYLIHLYNFIEKILDIIACVTPMYLFNLVCGSSILIFNEDLASSLIFQYIVSACFGTVLALIALAIVICR